MRTEQQQQRARGAEKISKYIKFHSRWFGELFPFFSFGPRVLICWGKKERDKWLKVVRGEIRHIKIFPLCLALTHKKKGEGTEERKITNKFSNFYTLFFVPAYKRLHTQMKSNLLILNSHFLLRIWSSWWHEASLSEGIWHVIWP